MLTSWPPRTRFLMFTGKGGVGKTTVSCATAVSLAAQGLRTLLVSTDPASNVAQVYRRELGGQITALGDLISVKAGVEPVLDALEIDPLEEAQRYRESIVAPVRSILPDQVVRDMEETLSGSCTVEVAAFNRFVDFLVDPAMAARYDRIIFDTAPTGHTLRLLSLPGDWSRFIDKGTGDASCLGPLSGLEKHRETYRRAVETLCDEHQTSLVLVTRAQEAAVKEAARAARELSELGMRPCTLMINGVLPRGEDALQQSLAARERRVLAGLEEAYPDLAGLDQRVIPLSAEPVMGVEALGQVAPVPAERTMPADGAVVAAPDPTEAAVPRLEGLIDEVAQDGPRIVLALGKGGVGKTTVAQAVAVGLARRGLPVLLATTDPAAHLDVTLARAYDSLEVVAIDPRRVVAEYREAVMARQGAGLDETGRLQLAEDLASPCTEEVAVFRAFSSVLEQVSERWVVVDTAPTGHTLLLLDATGSYHRELMRQSGAVGEDGQVTALMRLRDRDVTYPVVVTLPETTPILEAHELVADLERAQIEPRAWVVNQYLPVNEPDSVFLRQRAQAQRALVEESVLSRAGGLPVWTLPVA